MERWLIQLAVNKTDTEELPLHFPTGDIHAFNENGTVFLAGSAFEQLSDAGAVYEVGKEALRRFSGVLALEWPPFQCPTIEYVIREDAAGNRKLTTFAHADLMLARIKLSACGVVGDGGTTATSSEPVKSIARLRMETAATDERLTMVMQVWGNPNRNWQRLYLILEEVEAFLNTGFVKASRKDKIPTAPYYGLCSEHDYERFCRSANHVDVAGIDSRHGHDPKIQTPPKPMSLNEGTDFIKRLIEQTLDLQARRLAACSANPSQLA